MNALRQFDLGPGSSPLDVAAGNGDLGILPAHAGADVTAVDTSPTMIERLDKRAAHSGRLDVEAQVIYGVHLDFNCDSFAAHLAEMIRVGDTGPGPDGLPRERRMRPSSEPASRAAG